MFRRLLILPILGAAAFLVFSFYKADSSEVIIFQSAGITKRIVLPNQWAFWPERWFWSSVKTIRLPLQGYFLHSDATHYLADHQLLGLDQSFAVQVSLNYVYRLDSEKLPQLSYRLERPDQEGIRQFLKIHLKDVWFRIFRDELKADQNLDTLRARLEDYVRNDLVVNLNHSLADSGIVVESVLIEEISVPDAARYRAVLANGQRLIDDRLKRLAVLEEARIRRSADEILFSGKRKQLAELGELMGKYPPLREYIAIDELSDRVQIYVMPYDRFTGETQSPSMMRLPEKQMQPGRQPFQYTPNTNGGFRDLTPP